MRKKAFLLFGTLALLVGCKYDQYEESPLDEFTGGFEVELESIVSDSEPDTKTFADEQHLVLWHNDDRVSVFEKKEYWEEYKYSGRTGTTGGRLTKVTSEGPATGGDLDYYYAVYPHSELNGFDNRGHLLLTLPNEQPYDDFSFGRGTNLMVSASSDNNFKFKNIGGYLVFKLYGEGVSVSSIRLTGNNGEEISGDIDVVISPGVDPVVTISTARYAEKYDYVELVCDPPVALGSTAADYKEFWFVLPPMTFTGGFSIEVTTSDGGVWTKTTVKSWTITRNHYTPVSAMAVVPAQPNNVIYYTSTDGEIVTPYASDVFGANIISNVYEESGQGIITFDGEVMSIGEDAFRSCTNLSSITIPKPVSIIGKSAFWGCDNLVSVSLPNTVEQIEGWTFMGCSQLQAISLPASVSSIGSKAFSSCRSLSSLTIPHGVSSIEMETFEWCTNLTSVTLPESVTSISMYAFRYCQSLKEITIPDSCLWISSSAFSNCIGLERVYVGNGVQRIYDSAFAYCSNISEISFGDNLTTIDEAAFYGCSSLKAVSLNSKISSIGRKAFADCTALKSVIIGEDISIIYREAFLDCSSMESITVMATTPPTPDYRMFDGTNSCPIYVPSTSVDAYKTAWSGYADRIYAIGTPMAIDMGLSSGTKWASFNLGATKPEDYGDYYAWGETEPYYSSQNPITWKDGKENGYTWSSYFDNHCGDGSTFENYSTDKKTTLDPEDDAAHVILGGNWRMPTDAEWAELMNNCTWVWKTSVDGYANNGYLVTASNGNSIFLPAAGAWDGVSLVNARSNGYYWSSSLVEFSPPRAWSVLFGSEVLGRKQLIRSNGLPVRPVSD